MKFLICPETQVREELDAIANGLSNLGHQVLGFNSDIYRAHEEQKPEYLVFSPYTFKIPEIQDFIYNRKPKFFIVDGEKIQFSHGNSFNLPSFASTLKYKTQLASSQLECDVAIYYDGFFPDPIHLWYNKLYKDYRVKIVGDFVNCAGFVGLNTPIDVVKVARSARITISNNKIVTNSLIYNNIPALYNDVNINYSDDDLEDMVLAKKKNIVTEIQLGKKICEELRNSN